MMSVATVLERIRKERERNGYSRGKIVDVIRESSRMFTANAKRFGYSADHVSEVLAQHNADIAAIESGRDISIVKYIHQGAYICDGA